LNTYDVAPAEGAINSRGAVLKRLWGKHTTPILL
jgi:hypothetical protein